MTDPIADFLTRIRNAVKPTTKWLKLLAQKLSRKSLKILYEQGYILAYKFDTNEQGHPTIKIALKWDAATKSNAINESAPREPPRSAPVRFRGEDAPCDERFGNRHPFDFERYYDRCQGS